MGSTKGTSGPCSGRNPATRDALWRPAALLTATPPPKPPLERITELTFVKSCQVSSRASPCHTEGHSTDQDGHQQASEGAPGDSVGHQVRRHRGGPGRQPRAHAGHAQGCVTLGPPSPPFRPSRGTAVGSELDPDPTFRAPAVRPASRSHTKPSTVDLTSDPSNHSSTAGPEESPYEGGKFYVSHPPDRPSHHKSPLLASAFSSTCFLNKSPHR